MPYSQLCEFFVCLELCRVGFISVNFTGLSARRSARISACTWFSCKIEINGGKSSHENAPEKRAAVRFEFRTVAQENVITRRITARHATLSLSLSFSLAIVKLCSFNTLVKDSLHESRVPLISLCSLLAVFLYLVSESFRRNELTFRLIENCRTGATRSLFNSFPFVFCENDPRSKAAVADLFWQSTDVKRPPARLRMLRHRDTRCCGKTDHVNRRILRFLITWRTASLRKRSLVRRELRRALLLS